MLPSRGVPYDSLVLGPRTSRRRALVRALIIGLVGGFVISHGVAAANWYVFYNHRHPDWRFNRDGVEVDTTGGHGIGSTWTLVDAAPTRTALDEIRSQSRDPLVRQVLAEAKDQIRTICQ